MRRKKNNMNLLVSYNWIKSFLRTDVSAEVFAKEMSLAGNSVERIHRRDEFLDKVVVGFVKEVTAHPDADRLRIAKVDVGDGVERQIVCGGENLKTGQWVPVALPGAKVKWHSEEVAEIKESKVRGVNSFGMICAAEEIGFEKIDIGERNIWDLSSVIQKPKVGILLAEVLGIQDDVVFDIEVTTNRPDAMSVLGQAREAAVVGLGKIADPMIRPPVLPNEKEEKVFTVKIDEPNLCSRYMGVVMEVVVGPSPWWIQERLIASGAKPINNVVDVTNYVRLELGQPLHTFDYEKLSGKEIIVRRAKNSESFTALDGAVFSLSNDMLVIADAERAVAIAGVMGGKDSGVTNETKTIVLEAATFDGLSVRKTGRALSLYSDSQGLFEKELSSSLPPYGLSRAVELLKEIANGRVISPVRDVIGEKTGEKQFKFNPKRVNDLLGVEVAEDKQVAIMSGLGFVLEKTADGYDVKVPFWREHDIEADIDFAEEVGRFYGYQNLPTVLPSGEIPRRERDGYIGIERAILNLYSGHGWTEVFSNSFISSADLSRALLERTPTLAVQNPLSEEQKIMRPSLVPSMLRAIADNEERGDVVKLFEVSRVYAPKNDELPSEIPVALISITNDKGGEELFRMAKGALELLFRAVHVSLTLKRENLPPWMHPGRGVCIITNDAVVGVLGEVHPKVVQAFGLKRTPAFLELDLTALLPSISFLPSYKESPEFPPILRDIAVVVDERTIYANMEQSIMSASPLVHSIALFDIYRGDNIGSGKKSLAIHISLSSKDRTLTSNEADIVFKQIVDKLQSSFGATIRD